MVILFPFRDAAHNTQSAESVTKPQAVSWGMGGNSDNGSMLYYQLLSLADLVLLGSSLASLCD
jgi:hypothetical protein